MNNDKIQDLVDALETTHVRSTPIDGRPSDYNGVGAYVWRVQLGVSGDPLANKKMDAEDSHVLVMTNDAAPDADFKKVVDSHREYVADAIGTRMENVQVRHVTCLGFARGINRSEAVPEPDISKSRYGEVIISPRMSRRIQSFMDRMENPAEYNKAGERSGKIRDRLVEALNDPTTRAQAEFMSETDRVSVAEPKTPEEQTAAPNA